MKLFYYFLFSFLLISFVSAAPDLILQNDNPQADETILGVISTFGEFVDDISKDDISFYEGRKEVFFDYDLVCYENKCFFSTIFTRDGNFTIKSSEILYKVGSSIKSFSIEKEIEVKDYLFLDEENNVTGTKKLLIEPAIFESKGDVVISFTNIGDFNIDLVYGEEEFKLFPEESYDIIVKPSLGLSFLNVESYDSFSIPIIYLGEGEVVDNNATKPLSNLKIEKKNIKLNLSVGEILRYNIGFFNLGIDDIKDFKFLTNIDIMKLEGFEALTSKEINNLSLVVYSEEIGQGSGKIKVVYNENGFEYEEIINLDILIFGENSTKEVVGRTCSDLGGLLCVNGICTGESSFTTDGFCCFSECVEDDIDELNSNGGSSSWIWGIVILIVVGIVVYFVYNKYKKVKPVAPQEKIEVSEKKYDNRLKGSVARN